MSKIAHHQSEMMRLFEAGKIAEARWHCRIWTRLVAAQKKDFFNDGSNRPIASASLQRAGTPSPYNAGEGEGLGK